MWGKIGLLCAAIALVSGYGGRQTEKTDSPATTASTSTPKPQASEDPVTRSTGGVFRGSWMRSRRGRLFQAYRGIRYAAAPVGPRRFQPPEPVVSYAGEVDAREDGPACPLIAHDTYPVSEDCLTVNVYTPGNKRQQPLPVVVYIHAGGFYSMTGRSDVAGPHYLMDRDLVLVTLNYRLGALGWLSTGDSAAPGNNGMKDQVAALKWVQRNIAAFGGDPTLVTIAGCSAGSISVMLHMISPMSKGLFHRGISMSASPVGKEPMPRHQRHLAERQAHILNCPTHNSTAILDCLKTKTIKELGDWRGLYEFGFDPVGLWNPVVEEDFGQERFLPLEPLTAIKQGKMHSVPYVLSQTEDEFFWMAFTVLRNETLRSTMNREWSRVAPISFMLPRDHAAEPSARLRREYLRDANLREGDEDSVRGLTRLYGDSIIGFPTHRLANLMSRHSAHPVWYYQFSYIGNHSHYEDPITKKPTGAAHHDDLIYLFSLSYRFPAIPADDSHDSKMVDLMTGAWHDFAKYGDPNPPNARLAGLASGWPAMTPVARKYLRVAQPLQVRENLNEDRYKLWEELYPIQY